MVKDKNKDLKNNRERTLTQQFEVDIGNLLSAICYLRIRPFV